MAKRPNESDFERLRQEPDDGALSGEEDAFLGEKGNLREERKQRIWSISARVSTIFNICLSVFLIGLWAVAHRSGQCWGPPGPAYSPVREDGFVRQITKRIYPQKVFQSETSDEVEKAWNKTMGASEGMVRIHKDRIGGLPQSVQAYGPGQEDYYMYGLAVYHQLHCLNRIRKTFYADKFFPDDTKEDLEFHKNHCFDVLRQGLMCNADVSLIPWWNTTWSHIDKDGKKQYSQDYLSMTRMQRAKTSYVVWDLETKCIDMDALEDYVVKH